jgi:hypothetical protein
MAYLFITEEVVQLSFVEAERLCIVYVGRGVWQSSVALTVSLDDVLQLFVSKEGVRTSLDLD